MDPLGSAFLEILSPSYLAYLTVGVTLGVVVGAIPGLTGAMLITLTLPLTFHMEAGAAVILLVSMYVGSVSGGMITAVLLRIPGTPASMITILDGYPLAVQGRAHRALSLGIAASAIGGVISWGFLAALARPISVWSTQLGPFEMFSLVAVALALIAAVSGESLTRGLLAGALGLLTAMPGITPTGQPRWTLGQAALNDGFQLLPVLIGVFGVSQVLQEVFQPTRPPRVVTAPRHWELRLADVRRFGGHLIRSSILGTWIGVLPGVGANIGSVVAYTVAKFFSRAPGEFGKGSEEGLVASEAANNATVGGALIPLISMGIPGSVIDAILLGALVLHNLQPGPMLFANDPREASLMIAAALVANLVMVVVMVLALRPLTMIAATPKRWLFPFVLASCVLGTYALGHRQFDVWVMLGFGVLGWGMERAGIPLAPFVIGLVLAPIAEEQLTAAVMSAGGSYLPLVTRPISACLLAAALAILILTLASRRRGASRAGAGRGAG